MKQLPGIGVDRNGNVTSQGQPVNKLRVNGKDFFTGNVKDFIRQLPTGILTKVQVVNDYGDDAAFTGVKRGEPVRQLNLITKPGMDNGVFGSLSASIGSNKYGEAGAGANFWKQSKQISAEGNYNNNKTAVGSSTYKRLNASYNDAIGKKFRFSSSYAYTIGKNSYGSDSFSETVNTIGVIDNSVKAANFSSNQSHNINFSGSYNPDKKTYITLSGSFAINNNIDSAYSNSQQSGVIKQGLLSNSSNDVHSPNGNFSLSISRVSETKKRVLTIGLGYGSNTSTKTSVIDRLISYYNANGTFIKDSVYNNLLINNTRSENIYANLTFSQAISSKSNLGITYNYTLSKQHNALSTYVDLATLGYLLVDSLSNDFHNSSSVNRVDIYYRYNGKKFRMSAGINAQRNTLSDLSADHLSEIYQTTNNFSPNISMDYTPNNSYSWNMGYNGFSQSPTIDQLQPTPDARNIQNVVIGNPDLKPSFSHQLGFGIRRYSQKSGQSLFLGFNGLLKQNEIISNTVMIQDTLNTYKQRTTYVNENGGYTLSANYDWNIPFKIGKLKFNGSYNGNLGFTRQVVYADNQKAFNHASNVTQNLGVSQYIRSFGFGASLRYSTTNNHYTVGQGLSNRVSTYSYGVNSNYTYKEHTFFNFDLSKNITSGYTKVDTNNPFVINASIGRMMLKNNKLNVRFSASDILNQASHFSQIVSGNTVTNSRTNYVTRYFTLSASYSVSSFGKLR